MTNHYIEKENIFACLLYASNITNNKGMLKV